MRRQGRSIIIALRPHRPSHGAEPWTAPASRHSRKRSRRRTAALGASIIIILMLGGIGTHVAAGDRMWWRSEAGPIVFATIVLLARYSRLRSWQGTALLPLR
ncbi:MAG TPA: hypothetical protein VJ867_01175 [Gemmatimonadaceae bacterium]|nr:hypothetical protein [Gemmatimonadaceae bacterium]